MEEKGFKSAVEEANASVPKGKVKAKVREIEQNGGVNRNTFNNIESGTAKSSNESNENFNQMENSTEQSTWKNALNSLNQLNIKDNLTAAFNAMIPDMQPRSTISSSVDPFIYGNEARDLKTGLHKDIVIPLDEFLRSIPAPPSPRIYPQSLAGDKLTVDRPIVCCPLEQTGHLFSAPTNVTPGYVNPPMYPNMYPTPYPINPWDPNLFPGIFPFGNDIFGEESLKQASLLFREPNASPSTNDPSTQNHESNDKAKKRRSTKKKKKKKKRKAEERFEPSIFSWSHPYNRKSKWWEVWNTMESTALKKEQELHHPEFCCCSTGQHYLPPCHRVTKGTDVICTCGHTIPRPIVAHMHSNKTKYRPLPVKCQCRKPLEPSCQHANCTHSNRTPISGCCPFNMDNVRHKDITEEGLTEVNATMVRSIQVSMRSRKNNHSKTKKFNLDIQTANLLGSLFLGSTAASSKSLCRDCTPREHSSSPRATKGSTENYHSVPCTTNSVSPSGLRYCSTGTKRNCQRDENLNFYDSSFSMSSVPGHNKQGRHLRRLMSHFYHDLFTLPPRSDHVDVMDCTCCDDVDGCYPVSVSLSTNTNRSNTALAQPMKSRTFPKTKACCAPSPPRCCKGRDDYGYEQMETCCRRSNGSDKYFFESSKYQKCRNQRDFIVDDAHENYCDNPNSCKRCLTATDRKKDRKAEKCLSFQCSSTDDATHKSDNTNYCTSTTNVCHPKPCTYTNSSCHSTISPRRDRHNSMARVSKTTDYCKKKCKCVVRCDNAACSSESSSSHESALNETSNVPDIQPGSNSYVSTLHVVARGSCKVCFCKKSTKSLRRQAVCAKNHCVRREALCSDKKCLVFPETNKYCSENHGTAKECCCTADSVRHSTDACSSTNRWRISCPGDCEDKAVHKSDCFKCDDPTCCKGSCFQRYDDNCKNDHKYCCNKKHRCCKPSFRCENSQPVCHSPDVSCGQPISPCCKKSKCEEQCEYDRLASVTRDKKQSACRPISCRLPADPVCDDDDADPCDGVKKRSFVKCKNVDRSQVCQKIEKNLCEFICLSEDQSLSSHSSKEKACSLGLKKSKPQKYSNVDKRLNVGSKHNLQSQFKKAACSHSEIIQKYQTKDFREANGILNREKRILCPEKRGEASSCLVTSPGNAHLDTVGPCIERTLAKIDPCMKQISAANDFCINRKSGVTSPCIKKKSAKTSPCIMRKSTLTSPFNKRKSFEGSPCTKRKSAETSPCTKRKSAENSPCIMKKSAKTSPCTKRKSAENSPCTMKKSAKTSPCIMRKSVLTSCFNKRKSFEGSPCTKRKSAETSPCTKRKSAETSPCTKRKSAETSPCTKRKSAETSPCTKRKSAETSPCIMKKSAETSPCTQRKSFESSPCIMKKTTEKNSPCISRKSDNVYECACSTNTTSSDEISGDSCRLPCFESNCKGCKNHIPFEDAGKFKFAKNEAVATITIDDDAPLSAPTSNNTSEDVDECKLCRVDSHNQDTSESNPESLRIHERASGPQQRIIITSKSSLSQDQQITPLRLNSPQLQAETDQPWSPCLPNFICPTENANEQTYVQYKRLLGYWEYQCSQKLGGANVAGKCSETSLNKLSLVSAKYHDESQGNPDFCPGHEKSVNGGRRSIVITQEAPCSQNKESAESFSSINQKENCVKKNCKSSSSLSKDNRSHHSSPRYSNKMDQGNATYKSKDIRDYQCKQNSFSDSLKTGRRKKCLSNDSTSPSDEPPSSRSESKDGRLQVLRNSSDFKYTNEANTKPCFDHVDESQKISESIRMGKKEKCSTSDFNYKNETNTRPCFDHVDESPKSENIRMRKKEKCISSDFNNENEGNQKHCSDHVYETQKMSERIRMSKKEKCISSDFNYKNKANQKLCLDHANESPLSQYSRSETEKCHFSDFNCKVEVKAMPCFDHVHESPLSKYTDSSHFITNKDTLNCLSMDSIPRNNPKNLNGGGKYQNKKIASHSQSEVNDRQERKCLSFEAMSQKYNCDSVNVCRCGSRSKSPRSDCAGRSPSSHSINTRHRRESPSYNRLNLQCPSADILNKEQSSSSDRSRTRKYPELSCSDYIATKEKVFKPSVDCDTRKQRVEILNSHPSDKSGRLTSPCFHCCNGAQKYKSVKSLGGISKLVDQESPRSAFLSERKRTTESTSEGQMAKRCTPEKQMSSESTTKRQRTTVCTTSERQKPSECTSELQRTKECTNERQRPPECTSKRYTPRECISERQRTAECTSERQRTKRSRPEKQNSTECTNERQRPIECTSGRYTPRECPSEQQRTTECTTERQISPECTSKLQRSSECASERQRTTEFKNEPQRSTDGMSHLQVYTDGRKKRAKLQCTSSGCISSRKFRNSSSSDLVNKVPCCSCTGSTKRYRSPSYHYIAISQGSERPCLVSIYQKQPIKNYFSKYTKGRQMTNIEKGRYTNKKHDQNSPSFCTTNVVKNKDIADGAIARMKCKSPSVDSINKCKCRQCSSSVSLYKICHKKCPSSHNPLKTEKQQTKRLMKHNTKSPHLNCLSRSENQEKFSKNFTIKELGQYKSPCLECVHARSPKRSFSNYSLMTNRKALSDDKVREKCDSSSDCGVTLAGHINSRTDRVKQELNSDSPPTDSTDKVQRYRSPCLECVCHVKRHSSYCMRIQKNQESVHSNLSDKVHTSKNPFADCIHHKEGSPFLGCSRKRRSKKIMSTHSLDLVSKQKPVPYKGTQKYVKKSNFPCRESSTSDISSAAHGLRPGSKKKTFKCLSSSSEECSTTSCINDQSGSFKNERSRSCIDPTAVKFNASPKISSLQRCQKENDDNRPSRNIGHSTSNERSLKERSNVSPCFACCQCSTSSSETVNTETTKTANKDNLHDFYNGAQLKSSSSVFCVIKSKSGRDGPLLASPGRNSPRRHSKKSFCHEKKSSLTSTKQLRQDTNNIENMKTEKDRSSSPRPCTSCSRPINRTHEQKCRTVHTSHKECASHKIPLSIRCPGSNECLGECSNTSCLGEIHRFSKWHCVSCQPASDIVPSSTSDVKCSKKETALAECSLPICSKENKNSVYAVSLLNSSCAAINLAYNLEALSSSNSSSLGHFPQPTLLLSNSSHVTSGGLRTPCLKKDSGTVFPFAEKNKENLSSGSSVVNETSVLSGQLFSCATRCSISSVESDDSDDDYGAPNLCPSYDDCLSLSESEGCQSQNCSYPTHVKNYESHKSSTTTRTRVATMQPTSRDTVPQRRFCVRPNPPVSQTSHALSECRDHQARSPQNQMTPVGCTSPAAYEKSQFSQVFTVKKPFDNQACLKIKQQGSMDLGKNGVKETNSSRYNDKHLVKYPLRGFKRCTSLPSRTANTVGRNTKLAASKEQNGASYVSTLSNIEENKPIPGTDLSNVVKRLENCDSKEFWKILYDVKNGKLDEKCLRESLAGKISGIEYTAIKTRETIGTKTVCTARNKSDGLRLSGCVQSTAREGRTYCLARTKSKDSCLEGRAKLKLNYSTRPHSTDSQIMNSKATPECEIDNMIMSTGWRKKPENQNTAIWEVQNNKCLDDCEEINEVVKAECRYKPVQENQTSQRRCNERHMNGNINDEFITENNQEQKERMRCCRGKTSPKCLTNEIPDSPPRSGARVLKTSRENRSPPRMGLNDINASNIPKYTHQVQSRKKCLASCTRERVPIISSIPDENMASPKENYACDEYPSPPSMGIKTCGSGTKVGSHESEAACTQKGGSPNEKPPPSSPGSNSTKRKAPYRPVKRNGKKKLLSRVSSSSTSQKHLEEKLPAVSKKTNKIKYISRFHKPLSSKFKTTVTSSIAGETSVVRLTPKKKKSNAKLRKKNAKSTVPPSSSLSSLSSNESEASVQKMSTMTKKHSGKQSSHKMCHKSCSKAKSRCLKCKLKREKALLKLMPPNIGCDIVSNLCNEYLDVLQHIQNNIRLLKTVSKMPSPGSTVSSPNSQSDNSSYPHCESSDLSGNVFPCLGHQHSSRHPVKQDLFGEVGSRRGSCFPKQPRYTRIHQYKKNGAKDLLFKYKVLKNALKLYRKNFPQSSGSLDIVERQLPARAATHNKLQASCLSSSSWSDTLDDEPPSQSKKSNKFNHQMPKFSPSAERLLCQMCSPCRKRTIRWGLGDKDQPITKTLFHELKNETNNLEAGNDRQFYSKSPMNSSVLQDKQCCPLCKRKPNTLITTLDILKGISKTVSSRKDDESCRRAEPPTGLKECSPTCDTRSERRLALDPCSTNVGKKTPESFYESKVPPKTFQPLEQTPDIQRYAELKKRLENLKSKQKTGSSGGDKKKKTSKRDTTKNPSSNVRKNKQNKQPPNGSMLTKYNSPPNTTLGLPSKLSPEFFNKSGLPEKRSPVPTYPGSSPRINNITGSGFKSIITVDHFETFNLKKYALHNPSAAAQPKNTANPVEFYKQTKSPLPAPENAKPNVASVQPTSQHCSSYVQNKIDELKQFIAASSNAKTEHPIIIDEAECVVELTPVSPRRMPSTSESSGDVEQPPPRNVHTPHPITLLQDLVRDDTKAQSQGNIQEEAPAGPVDNSAGNPCPDQNKTTSTKQDAIIQCELKRSRLKTPKNPEESSKNRKFLLISYNSSKAERNESQNRTAGLKNKKVLGQIDNVLDNNKASENCQNLSKDIRLNGNEMTVEGACFSVSKSQNVNDLDLSEAGLKVEDLDVIYKSTDERNSSSSGEEAWHNTVPSSADQEDDDLRTEVIDTDISFY